MTSVEDEKVADKLSEEDKKTVLDKCNEAVAWIDANQTAEKDELKTRRLLTSSQKKTRKPSWTNATKLWPGSMPTKQLKKMSLKTRRKKSKVFALQSSRSCMLLLEELRVVCQEVCQIWVQVLEVDQLSKKLIKRTVFGDDKKKKETDYMDCPYEMSHLDKCIVE